MFNAIADASTKPLIVYNIASRTGVNVQPSTFVKLAENPKITAVKEASGNLSQVADIAALVGDKMAIYSGNDDQILPVLSLGGCGVISVLSNLLPKETSEMCRKYFNGDAAGATAMQLKYLPLIHALFSEVNPIPVKAAMAAMGFGENYVRLPLTEMEEEHEKVLLTEMKKLGLI
jgi:4-hydroxy-tetrahydrodipicolinate synthase